MNYTNSVIRESNTSSFSHPEPTVFVVDDDTTILESVASLICAAGWKAEVFASAQEFLARPRVHGPSCVVLDISLPDLNGLDVQRRIAVSRVDMPIIFITGHGDVPNSVAAMKAGAIEFLMKPFCGEVLLSSIRQALERSRDILRNEAALRTLRDRYASLTPRQQQVMALVVRGRLNKQCGGELGISEITVKAHRGRVMQKMKANSLPDLVDIAARLREASVYMG